MFASGNHDGEQVASLMCDFHSKLLVYCILPELISWVL